MANTLFSNKSSSDTSVSNSKPDIETPGQERPWRILLVDDEQDVLTVSKMALKGLNFEGGFVEIITAKSAAEAKMQLTQHTDIALAFIDVVMETDDAGLELVRWIRDEKKDSQIRLVLRTGQPGSAPEETVIQKYEINDYKNKTELNAIRLKTSVLTALRAYRDIKIISSNQRKLEQVLSATETILTHSKVNSFLISAYQELSSFLKQNNITLGVCIVSNMPYSTPVRKQFHLSSNGSLFEDDSISEVEDMLSQINIGDGLKPIVQIEDTHYFHYMRINEFEAVTLVFNFEKPLSNGVKNLLPHFTSNFVLVFENIRAKTEVQEVQQQLMLMLSEAIETRSKETGAHVLRVALICEFIAKKLGLSEKHVEIIKHSAPMHDLGKIGVPERILHKPGALDDEEWSVMKTHPEIGHKLLSKLNYGIPQMGAMVSLSHHEKWNGSGYPNGTKGSEIPLEGRLMAIADVVDALGSTRSYKKAWKNEDIVTLIQEQKGHHFDPKIADIVIKHFDEIMEIRKQYPDADQ
ncbi:response regulator [Vibrio maritimus]|uniref:Response regulator n=1 Tax=Vibrio maritimus TaxID=990268 RepID=A0A090T1B9_9VIBR|nr:response regulator [Vibrio maritimus]